VYDFTAFKRFLLSMKDRAAVLLLQVLQRGCHGDTVVGYINARTSHCHLWRVILSSQLSAGALLCDENLR